MKFILLLVAMIGVLVGAAIAQALLPPDVPPAHPAAISVREMIALGVMGTFPDGTFRGERLVSRYELAESLNRLHRLAPPVPVGSISGLIIGLPNLVVTKFATGSASTVPVTWGTCTGYYACREPIRVFMNGAVGDEMRVGVFSPYPAVHIRLRTPGAGGTVTWQYWTGSAWAPVLNVQDGTAGLTRDGLVAWSSPSNWPKVSLDGSSPFHWFRALALSAWSAPPIASTVGVPVPGATLVFRGPALWQTTAGADGVFSSPDLPVGAYVVDFSSPGWLPVTYLASVVPGLSSQRHIGPLSP